MNIQVIRAGLDGLTFNTGQQGPAGPVGPAGPPDGTTAAALTAHTANTSNPHAVTKAQVGLGNVNNTSDANKPISAATQTALDAKLDTTSTSTGGHGSGDSGKAVLFDNEGGITLTSDLRIGSGEPGTGVTLTSAAYGALIFENNGTGTIAAPYVSGQAFYWSLPPRSGTFALASGLDGSIFSADITDASEGGNGEGDYGKLAKFDSSGFLKCSNNLTVIDTVIPGYATQLAAWGGGQGINAFSPSGYALFQFPSDLTFQQWILPTTGGYLARSASSTGALVQSDISGSIPAAKGGFGGDISASSGVPLFTSGTATFTSTTGFGTFVRSNSPTLVTPVLGSASGTSAYVTGQLRANTSALTCLIGGLPTAPSTYGGFWTGTSSPTDTNYSLLGGNSSTLINATNQIELRIGNQGKLIVWSTGGISIGVNTDPGAGNLLVNGHLRAAGHSQATVLKTANYTATATDFTIRVDATAGAVTIALPAAASHPGRIYHIKKIDSSGNGVTVDPNASETIDGAATHTLATQYQILRVQSNGTNWDQI